MRNPFTPLPIEAAFDIAFPRLPTTSSVIDMFKAFWPLDRLLADLDAGEIGYVGPTPVMLDNDGNLGEVVPSLNGWTSCIERIARRLDIPVDISLLRRIGKRLEAGILLDASDLTRARALVDRCRAIYLASPVSVRKAATVEELIDIAVEEYGLREAA